MKYKYYYGLVIDLMVFSPFVVDYWESINWWYTDTNHQFPSYFDWQSAQLSMDFEYYNI